MDSAGFVTTASKLPESSRTVRPRSPPLTDGLRAETGMERGPLVQSFYTGKGTFR